MENGISLYPGQGTPWEESLAIIEKASACGLNRLFISLPEYPAEVSDLKGELASILKAARQNDMEVMANITPQTQEKLELKELSPSLFRILGIRILRLAEGFSPSEIASLSQNHQGIRIALNASTITPRIITALVELKADFRQLEALHNAYPRQYTGLSEDFLVHKTMLLHKAGIRVSAFVPGKNRQHNYLKAGCPTLENHREESTSLAARHLVALGIDSIFIGDLPPMPEELDALAHLGDNAVTLQAKWLTHDVHLRQHLQRVFTARQDAAQNAVRAIEGHALWQRTGQTITAENTVARPLGAVTIDNASNLPYMGEVQLCRTPLPADAGVNVVAQIDFQELNLIEYISPGRKFTINFHE
ncbi:MAG: MupG family TIM beta-alpha barrel fold protein [Selenomonas sp.]|uniref:MupG family TIM beta-alpha barrel fold protein n=1 Tax=Selenomonas sp. TaxID=2053611 RepID=UPI0025F56CF4|nr:MupG family TIM beta-alpha barrel fold protein [Selenomonas sp.]MCR5756791.1 MupG family TIM beta-alpha barrel fold protein [Selenomonas sp.]